jgi:hypothetical protein
MRSFILICIALRLYTLSCPAHAEGGPGNRKEKSTISLQSRFESGWVSIFLSNRQTGVYRRFILEKSLDGQHFSEVARTEESHFDGGSHVIQFRDFPFEKASLSCVFYRVRAVDELGWFDFTNTLTVTKDDNLAEQKTVRPDLSIQGGQF